MICPHCGYAMDAFDKECPRCHGKGIPTAAPPPPAPPPPRPAQHATPVYTAPSPATSQPTPQVSAEQPTTLQQVAALLLVGGILCNLYFYFIFDPTVPVPKVDIFGTSVGGGRVYNVGLLAQQQQGIMAGWMMSIAGFVLAQLNKKKES
jgi:hypothetical protein